MDTIAYHLKELEIALDEANKNRILPDIRESDQRILDIGCGIGQSFIALACRDRECIGLDIDEDALDYGRANYGDLVEFLHGDASKIPLNSDSIDLVFSRVALPYSNIPVALKEIRRCLKVGGRVWMTLHPKKMIRKDLSRAVRSGNLWNIIFNTYKMINGHLLGMLGLNIPFLNGNYESWQDEEGMVAILNDLGFEITMIDASQHLLIEAQLKSDSNELSY